MELQYLNVLGTVSSNRNSSHCIQEKESALREHQFVEREIFLRKQNCSRKACVSGLGWNWTWENITKRASRQVCHLGRRFLLQLTSLCRGSRRLLLVTGWMLLFVLSHNFGKVLLLFSGIIQPNCRILRVFLGQHFCFLASCIYVLRNASPLPCLNKS